MALPTYQDAGATSFSSGLFSPSWPTHDVDDIAIMTVFSVHSSDLGAATLNTANGFTLGGTRTASGTSMLTWFWARATSAAMSAPLLNDNGAAFGQAAQIATFRGCIKTGTPYHTGSSEAGAGATNIFCGGAETFTDDCLVVATIGANFGVGGQSFSAWANASLGSVTERIDDDSGNGEWRHGLATGTKAAAGVYGNTTGTMSTTSTYVVFTIPLKSEPVTGYANLLLLGCG